MKLVELGILSPKSGSRVFVMIILNCLSPNTAFRVIGRSKQDCVCQVASSVSVSFLQLFRCVLGTLPFPGSLCLSSQIMSSLYSQKQVLIMWHLSWLAYTLPSYCRWKSPVTVEGRFRVSGKGKGKHWGKSDQHSGSVTWCRLLSDWEPLTQQSTCSPCRLRALSL